MLIYVIDQIPTSTMFFDMNVGILLSNLKYDSCIENYESSTSNCFGRGRMRIGELQSLRITNEC